MSQDKKFSYLLHLIIEQDEVFIHEANSIDEILDTIRNLDSVLRDTLTYRGDISYTISIVHKPEEKQ